MKLSGNLKKVLRLFGTVLMLLSIFFIGRMIWSNRTVLREALSWKCVLGVFLFAVCNAAVFTVYGMLFTKLVCAISERTIDEKEKAVAYYVTANLYKYIPGNVMHYVGRNRLATEGYARFEDVNLASVIEVLCNVLAAAVVSGCLASGYAAKYIREYGNAKVFILFAIGAIIAAAILIIFFRERLMKIVRRCLKREVLLATGRIVLANIVWNIISGIAVVSFFKALGTSDMTTADVLTVIGCNTVCWLVGFVVIGAPGGIGVREALLSILLMPFAEGWIIGATGIMMRIGQITGEMAAALITSAVAPKSRN